MSMRAIIVDDEPPAREYLRVLLGRVGGVEVVGEAGEAAECLKLVASSRPDVLFLDIRLPGMSGIELAEIINASEQPPRVVFVTGYDEYAVGAFDLAAADYLMKPLSEDRLRRAVERLANGGNGWNGSEKNGSQEHTGVLNGSKLPIKQSDGWKLVEIRDILYVKTEGRKSRVQTRTEGYLSHFTICELEQRLGDTGFFRANEGCLVNLDCIKEIASYGPRTYEVFLNDPKETCIPLSRSRAQKLRELLKLH